MAADFDIASVPLAVLKRLLSKTLSRDPLPLDAAAIKEHGAAAAAVCRLETESLRKTEVYNIFYPGFYDLVEQKQRDIFASTKARYGKASMWQVLALEIRERIFNMCLESRDPPDSVAPLAAEHQDRRWENVEGDASRAEMLPLLPFELQWMQKRRRLRFETLDFETYDEDGPQGALVWTRALTKQGLELSFVINLHLSASLLQTAAFLAPLLPSLKSIYVCLSRQPSQVTKDVVSLLGGPYHFAFKQPEYSCEALFGCLANVLGLDGGCPRSLSLTDVYMIAETSEYDSMGEMVLGLTGCEHLALQSCFSADFEYDRFDGTDRIPPADFIGQTRFAFCPGLRSLIIVNVERDDWLTCAVLHRLPSSLQSLSLSWSCRQAIEQNTDLLHLYETLGIHTDFGKHLVELRHLEVINMPGGVAQEVLSGFYSSRLERLVVKHGIYGRAYREVDRPGVVKVELARGRFEHLRWLTMPRCLLGAEGPMMVQTAVPDSDEEDEGPIGFAPPIGYGAACAEDRARRVELDRLGRISAQRGGSLELYDNR